MNNVNSKSLLLAILFILFTCSREDKNSELISIADFPIQYNLNPGKQILVNDLGYGVSLVDTFLIIHQSQVNKDKNLLNIYDVKTLEFLGSVGKYGAQGPNEFIGSSYAGQYVKDEDGIHIWINDFPKSRMIALSIDKSLKAGTTIVKETIKYKPEYDFSGELFLGEQNYMIARQGGMEYNTNTNQFNVLKTKGDELQSFGEYPEIKNVESTESNPYEWVNSGYMAAHPNRSKYAYGLFYYDLLRIFDESGNILNTIKTTNYREYDAQNVVTKVEEENELRVYYRSFKTTEKYIFALVHDQKLTNAVDVPIPVSIRVFDWTGKLVAIINIPDYIISFAIDEVSGRLFAYLFEGETFLEYDISEILKQLDG